MAFWGVEVKPRKPFTQNFDDFKGRLHISLATLGLGNANTKSVLQCNVGSKSPVYLCSLFPEKAECVQLNLEFEEAEEVVFSVIGPRSIHLAGYFVRTGHHTNLDDNSESYGEDIANTEDEGSGYSDEEKYEDSFINDDEPEVSPPPASGGEEGCDGKKSKVKASRLRRIRKYHLSDSEDEEGYQTKHAENGTPVKTFESEDEDIFPISSLQKCNTTDILECKSEETASNGTGKTSDMKTENGHLEPRRTDDKTAEGNMELGEGPAKSREGCSGEHENAHPDKMRQSNEHKHGGTSDNDEVTDEVGQQANDRASDRPTCSLLSPSEASCEIGSERKKKRKKTEENCHETVNGYSFHVRRNETAQKDEAKANVDRQELGANGGDITLDNFSLLLNAVSSELDERPQKKTKGRSDEGTPEDIAQKADTASCVVSQDLQSGPEERTDRIADENQKKLKKKAKKKKKKKNNVLENGETNVGMSQISDNEIKLSGMQSNEKGNASAMLSQVKTLPSGLSFEEIEAGKSEGKIAATGKKISVNYTGMLKVTGKIFDSNSGSRPFKFRLGSGNVIEGWDIGLEGMRVGEKRRLVIPPSLGFGDEGHGDSVPPNTWLVYEVELVKVH